ncbi:methyltransferase domain-containing protein [Sutcliffiella horikoshii]|uniref:Methyltransferase domain-containing protein n=1 Tax=Sutcliffiella horikoshii TaxID=79883 RepID=A0A5D4SG56_9BACI|nr:class I SAM-dependent methyltransferase [Sutcliffiella horikoshii]TYS62597.1 methyltransferase domain-containing protein [Sutcliffiella horikoshii]
MSNKAYTDLLALLGIGGAHPGGLELTKTILLKESLEDKKLLEIGCGTGQTSLFLHAMNVNITPIDNHPIMIEKANHRFAQHQAGITALEVDIEKSEFKDRTFDFILSESVLTFTDTNKTLPELFRLLKEDGVLLAFEMTKKDTMHLELEDRMKQFYNMPNIFSKKDWKDVLEQHGFTKVEITPLSLGELEPSEPEINPSEEIEEKYFEVMHDHEKLTYESQEHVELTIIRAQR